MKLMESPFYGKPCSTRRDTARAQADGLISGPRSVAPARIFGVVSLGMTAGRNRRVMLAVEAVIDQAAGGAVVRMPLLCTKRLQFTAHDLLDLPTGAIVAHPQPARENSWHSRRRARPPRARAPSSRDRSLPPRYRPRSPYTGCTRIGAGKAAEA